MDLDFQTLRSLLRRRADNVRVVELIGTDPSAIERDEFYGSVEFPSDGVECVFKEAPWVLSPSEITDNKALYVSGFHFHRAGHEGYQQYMGQFPGGVAFNDSEKEIRRKLGKPSSTGGGGMSSVLKKPIPRWLRYNTSQGIIRFQLDVDGTVQMVTLFVEQSPVSKGHESVDGTAS